MGLAIHVNQGDWGGAQLSDIEAVARSAADGFNAFDDDETVAITLEPTASEDDPPMTLSSTSPGRSVVRLNVRGNLWARLAYQFGHEYCHVVADQQPEPTWGGASLGSRKHCVKLVRSSLSAAWREGGLSIPLTQAGESILLRSQRTKPNMSPIRCVPCSSERSSPTGCATAFLCLKRIHTEGTTTPSSPRSSCESSRPTVPPGEPCDACIPRHSRRKLQLPDSCVIGLGRARQRIGQLLDRSLCASSLAGIARKRRDVRWLIGLRLGDNDGGRETLYPRRHGGGYRNPGRFPYRGF